MSAITYIDALREGNVERVYRVLVWGRPRQDKWFDETPLRRLADRIDAWRPEPAGESMGNDA